MTLLESYQLKWRWFRWRYFGEGTDPYSKFEEVTTKHMIERALSLIEDHDERYGNSAEIDEAADLLLEVIEEMSADEQRAGNT